MDRIEQLIKEERFVCVARVPVAGTAADTVNHML